MPSNNHHNADHNNDRQDPGDRPVVRVESITDLIAAIPHLFGFQPADSLVIVPLTRTAPTARIDHPHDGRSLMSMTATLGAAYRPHVGARLVLVAYCEDETHAVDAITATTAVLDGICEVVDAFIVDAEAQTWFRLATGERCSFAAADVSRIDAEFTLAGRAAPVASRAALAADLIGTPEEAHQIEHAIADLPDQTASDTADTAAGDAAGDVAGEAEAAWVRRRVEVFVYDQEPLSVEDTARMLHAINTSLDLRDAAWLTITPDTAHAHVALWRDLVRRAPAAHRTPAAALLAFAAWITGNGALGWVALDLIPTGPDGSHDYTLARLVAEFLTNAVSPDTWGIQAPRQ